MAVALLLPRHVFGLKGDVKDNFAYYDEQTVVYPAGHNMIIHNLEQRTQKFLTGTEKTDEITAMCVSPNKKFVAVAEKVVAPVDFGFGTTISFVAGLIGCVFASRQRKA